MRWCVAALLLLGACRTRPLDEPFFGGGGDDQGVVVDMGGRPGDLAHAPDLAPAPLGCEGLVQCILQCADQNCEQVCENQATAKGLNLFDRAENCAIMFCEGVAGVAPPRCTIDSTGNLVDAPGVPPGDCDVCLQAAVSPLFQIGCSTPGDPACDPQVCQSDYESCINN